MMRWLATVALGIALAGLPLAQGYADDKAAGVQRIAVVDLQRIMQESMASKSIQKQLESLRAKYQKETEGEENSLRQTEQALARDQKKVSADVYGQREQQLRERFLSVERMVNARRKSLDQSYTDSMNTVRATVQDIVAALAKAQQTSVVLAKQQTLWVDNPLDMTDDVLSTLNKKLPRVDIKADQDGTATR
jgi:outer membrane protein